MRSLMWLLPATARITGSVRLDGVEVTKLQERELRKIRGSTVAMVFQDPMSALDPVFTIGQQIIEVVVAHEGVSRTTARARALELLEMVQIPSAERRLDAFPHELSGGLRQRAMIALALSCRPKLLLADEPTTALDATVEIQILVLLRELQRELGMAIILVTHDLGVASEIADRVAVMYAGRLVETAAIGELIRAPRHPYTAGLLASTVGERTQDFRFDADPGCTAQPSRHPERVCVRAALHAHIRPLHRRGTTTHWRRIQSRCSVPPRYPCRGGSRLIQTRSNPGGSNRHYLAQ